MHKGKVGFVVSLLVFAVGATVCLIVAVNLHSWPFQMLGGCFVLALGYGLAILERLEGP